MRKILGLTLTAALALTAFAAFPAAADSDNAALVVWNGENCYMFGTDGSLTAFDEHVVENNRTGKIVCKGDVFNDTGRAVKYNQENNPVGPGTLYVCSTGAYDATWHQTIAASGKSTLVINCGTTRS